MKTAGSQVGQLTATACVYKYDYWKHSKQSGTGRTLQNYKRNKQLLTQIKPTQILHCSNHVTARLWNMGNSFTFALSVHLPHIPGVKKYIAINLCSFLRRYQQKSGNYKYYYFL
jgi:hypothetical protein